MSQPSAFKSTTDRWNNLRLRLLRLAGYGMVPYAPPAAKFSGYESPHGTIQAEFRHVLVILEEIAARKVDGYGPFRYTELEYSWRWEIQSLYLDIERKFGRLKEMIRPDPRTQAEGADQILETLADLSVYAARGIQIITRLESMDETSRPEAGHIQTEGTRDSYYGCGIHRVQGLAIADHQCPICAKSNP